MILRKNKIYNTILGKIVLKRKNKNKYILLIKENCAF